MSDEPHNESEYLDRESRLAREALQRLRGEMLDSLMRTADANAWTRRYPWQSLSAAAVAGVGAGWAMGSAFRRKPAAGQTPSVSDQESESAEAESPHAASRLVSGLGALTGALASAAFAAATEALSETVRSSIHDALHPEPPEADVQPTGGNPASTGD